MTDVSDPFNLQRFVDAQRLEYVSACEELSRGQKRGHWMWYIFPQIKGLAPSGMSIKYAISSRAEAEAYLRHRILGPRLMECSGLVLSVQNRSIGQIFGSPDDLKLRSSMTLFAITTTENKLFQDVLQKYFNGQWDNKTLDLLKST